MRKFLITASVLALAAGALPASAEAETLRWARVGDALTLDPHSQNEGPTHTLNHHIYETLVGRAVDGSLTPRLATEWGITEDDDTVWEFKIREGVTFHDGQELTAEDVVFSLDRARTPPSGMAALHAAVEEVTAVDDYTVHVKLSGPAPLYVQNLTNTFIMSKEWAEENDTVTAPNFAAGEESYSVRNTNGTGPYRLVERDPEVRTVLARFEDHWDDAPEVTEIIYTPISEAATRVAALLSGEVDIVQDVPVQDIARLEGTDGIKRRAWPGEPQHLLLLRHDVGDAGLGQCRRQSVRQGGSPRGHGAGVDRDAIRQVVMRGESDPSAAPLPPFVNGWTEEMHAYDAPDIERALELMSEAGYEDGFSVDMHCPNDRYLNDEAICQALVGMLGRINMNVNLVSQTRSLHFPLIENWETDFYLLGWGVPTFDSQYVFDFLVHTREGSYGAFNGTRYSNPELDAKIESLATMTDLEARDAIIAEIWDEVMEDRIFLNIHNQVLAYAMRDGINLEVHPENQPRMTTVTFD
jgi:peptide/nickel transport system substrate-binding protein